MIEKRPQHPGSLELDVTFVAMEDIRDADLCRGRRMTAEIVDLPTVRIERSRGNGARDALIEVGELLPNTTAEDAEKWADWLLAEFWLRGFKVVPVE